jgi:AraC-like DNA-binding protein
MPSTPAFSLGSEPDLTGPLLEPGSDPVRHGEPQGEPDFVALGGSFSFERANAPLLLALLPGQVFIPAAQGMTGRLGRTIDLLAEECRCSHPGRDLIIQRMLEVLLVEALRWAENDHALAPAGLLAGLRDPSLARALAAMHADIRADWTVARLAGIAGMSRSAFSARFGAVVGCAPIEYLIRWRMAVARDALVRGGQSLDRIAQDIGYESASAFSTAFRKRIGCPPGSFARTCAGPITGS